MWKWGAEIGKAPFGKGKKVGRPVQEGHMFMKMVRKGDLSRRPWSAYIRITWGHLLKNPKPLWCRTQICVRSQEFGILTYPFLCTPSLAIPLPLPTIPRLRTADTGQIWAAWLKKELWNKTINIWSQLSFLAWLNISHLITHLSSQLLFLCFNQTFWIIFSKCVF